MNKVEGDFVSPKGRYALVAARFNAIVVDRLIEGARDALIRHGIADSAIDVVRVPGALELPLACQAVAESGKYVAIIALGTIIRGETSHYDVVVGESASKLSSLALQFKVPILNAVLTTENLEQAFDRAGGKAGNKGADAAMAAIEMVSLLAKLGDA